MHLSQFILDNMEPILQEWESFAKILFKTAKSKKILRDHAKKMLLVMVCDLQKEQSKAEQTAKSKGQQPPECKDTPAEEHGIQRLEEGFSIIEIAAEYRALRASVTKLWGKAKSKILPHDIEDLIRFNEAIDQALHESIQSYTWFNNQQTRHFNTMLASSPDLSYIIDPNGILLYANKAMSELYKIPAHDIVGKSIYDLGGNVKFEEQTRIQTVLETAEPCRGDWIFQSPSGKICLFEYIYTPIFDEKKKIEAIAGNSRDITERKLAESKILQLAHTDTLTQLPNRRLFRDRLDQIIKHSRREEKHFTLLCIDLDKFKEVNDRLGHEVGDLLLQQVSKRLKSCVRDLDTIARMGGDEFMIILADINQDDQTKIIVNKILTKLMKPFKIKRQSIEISASIGITLYPQDGVKPDILMGKADKAMYDAKKLGQNQYSFYGMLPR